MPIFVPPYIAPTSTAPAEGTELEDVLHDVIAGITGLDATLVMPRWQPEPPNIPAAATAWCAFGFQPNRETSSFPQVVHNDDGSDTINQHETLEMLVSFYDLGAGGQADKYCALLRDGLYIAQNREAMFDAAGLLLIVVGGATPAPMLLKERWQYRVDLSFTVRRQIDRTYSVPTILSSDTLLLSQVALETPRETDINVQPPPP